MEQIAARLHQLGLHGSQFLQEARHPDLSPALYSVLQDKPSTASLEGYLFPDTYDVPSQATGKDIAAIMVRNLGTRLSLPMRSQAAREGLTVFKVLTLASIVEREAQSPSERPVISSVYTNRLKRGQGLFADPTVQYALKHSAGIWWPVIRVDPHSVISPYNTYLHLGLPPGPIANPGLSSIQAAINPARTGYLYFLGTGHGHIVFETTLLQHNADVCKYEGTGC